MGSQALAYSLGLAVGADMGVVSTHHTIAVMKSKIPAGIELTQHVHSYDHDSFLRSGKATVTAGGESHIYESPALLLIRKGVEHKVTAHTDCEWWCMHETDESGNIRP